jgi:hypothetical protein
MKTVAWKAVSLGMVAASLLVALQGVARAADSPCQAEGEKFCPGMTMGDGKYGPCMKQHQKDLSKACRKYLAAAAAREQDLKTIPACVADADKLCPDAKAKSGALIRCLRGHTTDLSSECKTQLKTRGVRP